MNPSNGTVDFQVIASDLLHPDDRAGVLAALATIKSGAEARRKANSLGFAVETIDPRGRVLVLKWKGADVALLYQRTLTTISLLPSERHKKPVVLSPDDAWVTLNLVGIRYDQELEALRTKANNEANRAMNLASINLALTREADQKGLVIDNQSKEIEALKEDNGVYRQAVEDLKRTGKAVIVKYRAKPQVKDVSKRRPNPSKATPKRTAPLVAKTKPAKASTKKKGNKKRK